MRNLGADAFGSVYAVLDGSDNTVVKFDAAGTFQGTFGPAAGSGEIAMSSPNSVDVDSSGNVYISDVSGIYVYSPTGTHLRTMSVPIGQLAIHNDELYVATAGRVDRRQLDGTLIETIGPGIFGNVTIRSVDVDPLGRIYAVAGSRIARVSADHTSADLVGTPGSNAGQYNAPAGVATDCRGNAYVLEVGRPVGLGDPYSTVLRYTLANSAPPPCERKPPPGGASVNAVDTQVNDIEVSQGVQHLRTYTAGPGADPTVVDIPETEPRARGYLGETQDDGEVVLRRGARLSCVSTPRCG